MENYTKSNINDSYNMMSEKNEKNYRNKIEKCKIPLEKKDQSAKKIKII